MRFWFLLVLTVCVLAGIVAIAYRPVAMYFAENAKPKYRTATVEQGTITAVVNSTGEVKPVLAVTVGAFVSGPVLRLHADFNQRVHKGDLLAEIDPRIYEAIVASDQATLANRLAEVERVKALLQQAIQQEQRGEAIRLQGEGFISPAEIDEFHFSRLSLDAQLKVAEAAVDQAKAALQNSQANLSYTKILAPVDGIVIDRKIDTGQTLAAQFQTPELFKIAPQMDEEMQVHASVDEADIGLIREAQKGERTVTFTVDAYPSRLFKGKISQIRFSSTMSQNVVTYPVIVTAANEELLLLPGMTADLSFEIETKENVIKVPNSALRFYPKMEQVRKEDQSLLDGSRYEASGSEERTASAVEQAALEARKSQRHVWVEEGKLLRAVPITTGISDSQFTELVSGELKVNQTLVVSENTR